MKNAFLNGKILYAEDAVIAASDRGFLLGDGVFETLLVGRGRAGFVQRHLQRMRRGLEALSIPAPADLADLPAIIGALAGEAAECVARVTVTRGPGLRGLGTDAAAAPTLHVGVSPVPPRKDALVLMIAPHVRFTRSSAREFKAISGYLENMLALETARRAGADDAVLLNEYGRAASATAANLIVVDAGGAARTPPAAEGALPGIVRGVLIEAGLLEEAPIGAESLDGALIALANSVYGLRIGALGGGARPNGRQEEAFARLQSCYSLRLEQDLSGAGA